MQNKDLAQLLVRIAVLDARHIIRDEQRFRDKVDAWAEVLDSDMPYEAALKTVHSHYADEATSVMPADLNKKWRSEKKRAKEREQSERLHKQFDEAQANAVPMPDHVRELLRGLNRDKKLQS